MVEVGYGRQGETLDEVWGRAVAEVFEFWAAQPLGLGAGRRS
jgi:hypothetical protein